MKMECPKCGRKLKDHSRSELAKCSLKNWTSGWKKIMSEDEEEKIVNLRGIAIISTFIVSCIILYIQTSQWNS